MSSDKDWAEQILGRGAVSEKRIIGLSNLPIDSVQEQFVGSSNQNAIAEGLVFYEHVRAVAAAAGIELHDLETALDFGTGWGRFARFLLQDFQSSNLFGVDVDSEMIDWLNSTSLPGNYSLIEPRSRLNINEVGLVIAYSVFTHLPLELHKHWSSQFKSIIRPGGLIAFTYEPSRFLDFVKSLENAPNKTEWHNGLLSHSKNLKSHMRELKNRGFTYLPTGGGGIRTSEIYGDAVCSLGFIENTWGPEFEVVSHVNDPSRFWQGVVVLRRLETFSGQLL